MIKSVKVANPRIFMPSHHNRDVNAGAASVDMHLANALVAEGCIVRLLFYDDALPKMIKGTFRQVLFPWVVPLFFAVEHFRKPYNVIDTTAGDGYILRFLLRILRVRGVLCSVRTHGLEHRHAHVDSAVVGRQKRKLSWLSRFYHYFYRLWEVSQDLKHCDVMIFLSNSDSKYARATLGCRAERIAVIGNGLPERMLGQRRSVSDTEVYRLLFLGSWILRKGIDLLPVIVQEVFDSDPRYTLTCAGVRVPREEVLSSFLPRHRERIEVIPQYENTELQSILSAGGVLLAVSRAEGAQLSILEAMAYGLVVICSRVGNVDDYIAHGVNGFVFEPEDVTECTRLLKMISMDYDRFCEVSQNAIKDVQSMSWRALARKRLSVWRDCEES